MPLRISLLGPPSIERDGEPVRLAGRKPWALLTYLLLEQRTTRRDIAARLVPEANDPLAALRWLLHQVRRALEPEVTIEEQDTGMTLHLADGVHVDLLRLLAVPEDVDEIEEIVRGELLEGMEFEDAPDFEMWLSLQRTRAHNAIAEALWWVTNRVATEDPDRALRLVERGLVFDPFCETTNELLIDLLVQTHNEPVARQRLKVIEARFRDELGAPPSDTVRRPLDRPRTRASVPSAPSARGLLESARARLLAGELDGAVETARRGADVALALDDPELELASLLLLATTLIHSHRGRSQEAKGLLSRAVQLATDEGDLGTLSDVEREMGFVFAMEPNYGSAEAVLARSIAHADAAADEVRAAKAETYLGMCASDRCDFVGAGRILTRAIGRLSAADELGWQGYAEAMRARTAQRAGDPGRAATMADIATDRVRRGGWTAVLPLPLLVAPSVRSAWATEMSRPTGSPRRTRWRRRWATRRGRRWRCEASRCFGAPTTTRPRSSSSSKPWRALAGSPMSIPGRVRSSSRTSWNWSEVRTFVMWTRDCSWPWPGRCRISRNAWSPTEPGSRSGKDPTHASTQTCRSNGRLVASRSTDGRRKRCRCSWTCTRRCRGLDVRRRQGRPRGRPQDPGQVRREVPALLGRRAGRQGLLPGGGAPAEAAATVHREAHGLVADKIYPVQEGS